MFSWFKLCDSQAYIFGAGILICCIHDYQIIMGKLIFKFHEKAVIYCLLKLKIVSIFQNKIS